jgi:hypothetical protein
VAVPCDIGSGSENEQGNRVRRRRHGASWCRARVASRCRHVAMQVCVTSRVRGCAGAQEHAMCSAHAGRYGILDLAR